MQRLVIASVVLLSVIGTSFAIRCYKCESTDVNCNNPTASMEMSCPESNNVCYKTSSTVSGSTMSIQRGCGRPNGAEVLGVNECKDIDSAQVKMNVCLCNSKDMCNSAGSFKISMTATGISVVLAMILTKFL